MSFNKMELREAYLDFQSKFPYTEKYNFALTWLELLEEINKIPFYEPNYRLNLYRVIVRGESFAYIHLIKNLINYEPEWLLYQGENGFTGKIVIELLIQGYRSSEVYSFIISALDFVQEQKEKFLQPFRQLEPWDLDALELALLVDLPFSYYPFGRCLPYRNIKCYARSLNYLRLFDEATFRSYMMLPKQPFPSESEILFKTRNIIKTEIDNINIHPYMKSEGYFYLASDYLEINEKLVKFFIQNNYQKCLEKILSRETYRLIASSSILLIKSDLVQNGSLTSYFQDSDLDLLIQLVSKGYDPSIMIENYLVQNRIVFINSYFKLSEIANLSLQTLKKKFFTSCSIILRFFPIEYCYLLNPVVEIPSFLLEEPGLLVQSQERSIAQEPRLERQSRLFVLMTLLSDGYYRLSSSSSSSEKRKTRQFFSLILRLPLTFQIMIAQRAYYDYRISDQPWFSSSLVDSGLRKFLSN